MLVGYLNAAYFFKRFYESCEYCHKFYKSTLSHCLLECPKSVCGKTAKFTFFVIKGALFSWWMWNFPRRFVSLWEIVSIDFQEHFTNRNSIISVFLVLSIERTHWDTWIFKNCWKEHFWKKYSMENDKLFLKMHFKSNWTD